MAAAAAQRERDKEKGRVVINLTACKYDVLRLVMGQLGWGEDTDPEGEKGAYSVYWTDTSVTAQRAARMQPD